MFKITLNIDGMGCAHCENGINNAIKGKYAVKSVASSHSKGETEIIAKEEIAREELEALISETGFKMVGFACEPYKKGFSLFRK